MIPWRLGDMAGAMGARYDGPERGPVYAQELLSQDRMTLIDIRVNRVIS